MPLRVEIGPREMRDKKYVVVTRDTGEKMSLEVAKMADAIPRMLDDLHERLFNK